MHFLGKSAQKGVFLKSAQKDTFLEKVRKKILFQKKSMSKNTLRKTAQKAKNF